MRSCLIQLLVLIAMVFALLWFGLPLGADWLATNSLNASGFTGTGTKVDVSAYPPPVLLTGHADSIHLTSSQVGIGDLYAASIDLTLGKVERDGGGDAGGRSNRGSGRPAGHRGFGEAEWSGLFCQRGDGGVHGGGTASGGGAAEVPWNRGDRRPCGAKQDHRHRRR